MDQKTELESAVAHSLQYQTTAVTPGTNFPVFTAAGFEDDQQFMYYDSNIMKMIPKTESRKKMIDDDPDHWKEKTDEQKFNQARSKLLLDDIKQSLNQTEGVHTLQNIYGCERYDNGTTRRYNKFGYDGEDFISLDLKTETWTADHPKALSIKQKWGEKYDPRFAKDFLDNECTDWSLKLVKKSSSTLERKDRPKTELFQKDSSSPVVCHATGFFPKAVMMSWQKNGEDVHEDVELRETVPNEDGSFQKRSVLTVSPEELKKNKYTCVIQHSSLEEKEIHLSDIRVLTDGGSDVNYALYALTAIALLGLVVCVGFFIWKKMSGYRRANNMNSVSDVESNNLRWPPAPTHQKAPQNIAQLRPDGTEHYPSAVSHHCGGEVHCEVNDVIRWSSIT